MRRRQGSKMIPLILFAVLACSWSARAQESSSSPQSQEEKADKKTPDGNSSPSGDNPIKTPLLIPVETDILPIGSSSPLPSYETMLRWGPVYLRSLELIQSYDQLSNITGGAQGIFNQSNFLSTILRTDIVYDKRMRQSRLVFEYAPRLTVVNGHVSSDFLNQNLSLNWVQVLSPRWTLNITNTFKYDSVRSPHGDYYLGVPSVIGSSVPSSFLDGAGSWLTASTSGRFTYVLSRTSAISINPMFSYGHTSGQIITTPQGADVYQYGGHITWQKQLSPSRSLSADYHDQIVGSLGKGISYQGGEVGISQGIGPSTVVSISAGMLSAGFPSGRQWSFSGSVQAARTLGRSRGSIAYQRGLPLFAEVLLQGYSQRVDADYSLELSRRWYLRVQGGYEDTLTTGTPSVSGKFISSEIGHRLTSQISCYVSYAHKTQSGSIQNLLSGTRDYYMGGIRWDARAAPR